MGALVNGAWHGEPSHQPGAFVRQDSSFRGRLKQADLEEDPKRYCLFVAKACPWAHRTLIFRKLKGLEEVIDVHYVKPHMAEHGWVLENVYEPIDAKYLYQLYTASQADYSGKVTVPVLWDQVEKRIVNNESADIIEMLNADWNFMAKHAELDLMPYEKLEQISAKNDWIYERINNAVYRTGFAAEQEIYEKECTALFEALDQLESDLEGKLYILGDTMYACDIRLFTTLVRFDAVYVGHFKCNIRLLRDYPNLHAYMLRIYRLVADTVDIGSIKAHYYRSHPWINPNQIVALGYDKDLTGES